MRGALLAILLTTATAASGQNLVTNSAFTHDLSGWTVSQGTGSATWDPRDASAQNGSGSVKFTHGTTSGALPCPSLFQDIPVVPGERYEFRAKLFMPSGARRGAAGPGLQWLNSTHSFISVENFFCTDGSCETKDVWHMLSVQTRTAPQSAAYARVLLEGCEIEFGGGTLPFTAFVDDVTLWRVAALAANFTFSPTTPTTGQVVGFTDTSTGNPDQWNWDVDGNSTTDSTLQHPTFTYQNPGTYNVRLLVLNSTGNNSITKAVTISPSTVLDTDGDALPDPWETNGITVDGVFLDLPGMGANPRRKDLFVEVDHMKLAGNHTHALKPEASDLLIRAFWQAPVTNPDGTTGITLHLDTGSDGVMNPTRVTTTIDGAITIEGPTWGSRSQATVAQHIDRMGAVGFENFFELRDKHFAQERRTAFRYALLGHQFGGLPGLILGNSDYLGYANPGGTDFFTTLGAYAPDAEGSATDQALAFMHELGHTLGLKHGGTDGTKHKPNYLSVMNYSFGPPIGLLINGADGGIDYSRFTLPTLDEQLLDETAGLRAPGIPGAASYGTIWFIPPYCKTCRDYEFRGDRLNWNGTNGIETGTVSGDINNGNGTIHEGFNDWANLQFKRGRLGISNAPPAALTAASEEPFDEITTEIARALPNIDGFRITGPGRVSVQPGKAGTATFRIINEGERTQTLHLFADATSGWIMTPPPTPLTITQGTAQDVTITLTPSAGASTGHVTLHARSATNPNRRDSKTSTIEIGYPRRRAVRHPSPPPNLITNGRFDTSLAGWRIEIPGTAQWQRKDANGATNSGAALIEGLDPRGPYIWQCMNLNAANQYQVSADVFIDQGRTPDAVFGVVENDATDCAGNWMVPPLFLPPPTLVGAWDHIGQNITLRSTTRSMSVSIGTRGIPSRIYFDNVVLTQR